MTREGREEKRGESEELWWLYKVLEACSSVLISIEAPATERVMVDIVGRLAAM